MSIRTELPPGCSSLRMEDGTRYKARKPGGFVNVSEGHADAINRLSGNGDAGLLSAKGAHYIGTKNGRWCAACRRLWNVWNDECPRCGGAMLDTDATKAASVVRSSRPTIPREVAAAWSGPTGVARTATTAGSRASRGGPGEDGLAAECGIAGV